jgi:hypothetical protein
VGKREQEAVLSIVKEVADALAIVSDGIEHIQTVAKAVRDGRDFLRIQHPEVKADLAAMCEEMRNTSFAIAAASAVLTHFKFTVDGSDLDRQPARFNDYLVAHKEKAEAVSRSLHALRGHCHRIRDHAERLRDRAGSSGLDRMLQLFGIDSTDRDRAFAEALEAIYDEERQGYMLAAGLSFGVQRALVDISDTLGAGGTMHTSNVIKAASLLGEYSMIFSALQTQSNYVALDLQQTIDTLER